MEKLNIICNLLILEFIADLLLVKSFKIKIRFVYLLYLQIPKICANIICLEVFDGIAVELLIKLVSEFLCVIFLTESFEFKILVSMMFAKLAFLFSLTGCFWFIIIWIKSLVKSVGWGNICSNYSFIIVLLLVIYIFGIFRLSKILDKNRRRKGYLANVSLSLFGKHMCFYGLIDSGNSLRDYKTKQPVILLSKKALLGSVSKCEIDVLINSSRRLKMDTIAGKGLSIPIMNIDKIKVETASGSEVKSCVLGFVDEEFENGKYDCLLPRDYL